MKPGNKRPCDEFPGASSSSSRSPVGPPIVKKLKRAVTKKCPVCSELIPVRLLATHSELELDRVEDIIKSVGSTDVVGDEFEEEPSSRGRRSALRARKSLSAMNPRAAGQLDTLEKTLKIIQSIKRHRKQRHAKLKELIRDEEESINRITWTGDSDEVVCPVCLQTVRGDQDVTEAHVDACLAHESSQVQMEEDALAGSGEGIDIEGEMRERVTDESSFRGTGFHILDRNGQDIDDEVDIDGDDEFGDVQFTERDILAPASDPRQAEEEDEEQDREVEIDGDGEDETRIQQKSLRDLVAAEGIAVTRTSSGVAVMVSEKGVMDMGDPDGLEQDSTTDKKQGRSSTLVVALLNKVKQLESAKAVPSASLLCRICLESYTEPTASTGCWHTCCRECWLRCLGTTKLCPICKRITAAKDLRRIYL